MGYLLDTNAVSAILKNEAKVVSKMKFFTEKGEKLYISVVTDYEIKRGLFAVNATTKLKNYATTALLNDLTVVTDDSDLLRVPELKVENWLRE
jgi:tRNA(fMet)-specific endonuclease VapC